MYKKQITHYIKLGHAKLLSKEESSKLPNKTNYILHHGLKNVNKPGTVWVIFKSFSGSSTKFRHGKYVIMGDIEQRFLQVRVKEEYLDECFI